MHSDLGPGHILVGSAGNLAAVTQSRVSAASVDGMPICAPRGDRGWEDLGRSPAGLSPAARDEHGTSSARPLTTLHFERALLFRMILYSGEKRRWRQQRSCSTAISA
ncbi:MAG: hypothetical protein E6J90_11655 [Deltaproteobacteria bacterium]|nr:MAG: hypothetical protein E6J90_11655 [Deltaproteobacteria bacterium]